MYMALMKRKDHEQKIKVCSRTSSCAEGADKMIKKRTRLAWRRRREKDETKLV